MVSPDNRLGSAVRTTLLNHKGGVTESIHDAVYRLEVYSLSQIDKDSALKYLSRSIREQAGTTCKGAVNPAYVGEQFSENDFLFKLYIISQDASERGASIGFAIVKQKEVFDEDGLYIDVICAYTSPLAQRIYERRYKALHPAADDADIPSLKPGGGTILLTFIKNWAQQEKKYKAIELTALPYVVPYYKKQGYELPPGEYELPKQNFKSNEEFEKMAKIGYALSLEFSGDVREVRQALATRLTEEFPGLLFSVEPDLSLSVTDEEGAGNQEFTREINQILKDKTKVEGLKRMYRDIKGLERTGRVEKESSTRARGLPGIDGYLMTIRVDTGRGERKGRGSAKLRKNRTHRMRKSVGKSRRRAHKSRAKATRKHRSARASKSSKRHTRRG
jgi:hypothetical protein